MRYRLAVTKLKPVGNAQTVTDQHLAFVSMQAVGDKVSDHHHA
jgi:hypothetical protein